ncbi:MAG: hypothetical protein Q7T81_13730 [Pseudolabrys sp.]|nr:hypothetical protein [Pseudolabrys sp.]
MASEAIGDLKQFFSSLGGLHDVRIDSISIDVDRQTLEFATYNINAAFTNPGDPDCRPATLIFEGVNSFFMDVDMENEGIRITDVAFVAGAAVQRLEIDLNEGGGKMSRGRRSLIINFKSLQVQYGEPSSSS